MEARVTFDYSAAKSFISDSEVKIMSTIAQEANKEVGKPSWK